MSLESGDLIDLETLPQVLSKLNFGNLIKTDSYDAYKNDLKESGSVYLVDAV